MKGAKTKKTPVTFNGVYFYVCRVMDRNGKEGLEVFSCEHFNPYEKKFDIDRGSGEIKLTSPSAVSCVSAADSAVTNAISFFNALGLEHIALELGRTAEDGRIYITDIETDAPYGSIFLSLGRHGQNLAAVLIAAYLKMLDADILAPDIRAIKNAYNSYVSSVSSFSAEEHIEEGLLMTLLSMETSLKNPAANEGGLKLHPSAYSHMIDLSGVSMKDCEDIGVIEDVRKIFTEVVEHFYGMKWVKAYVAQMDGKPDIKVPPHVTKKENLPGKGDRLLIRKISNGLLPSALSLENGTIILNENFLKMLYKIKKDFFIGDQKYDGYLIGGIYDNEVSIFDETDMHTPYLGNFYISLIYSVAYHEIKGHYEINDEGEFIHRRDENKAQAMRGGSKSVYVNVIAVSAYLLGFVEGGIRISGWKIEDFVRENPALFSNVPNSMRVQDRKKNLTCSIYSFFADKAGLGDLLSFFNKSKRIPIPFYSDLTFTELYDYVSRNPSKDLYVIAEEAGEGDPIEVEKKLEFLQRSGVLLKVERARDGKPLSIPVYVLTNAAKKNFDAVRQELSSIPKFLKAKKFDEYFEKLKAITAVDKMPVIDTQDKSVSKKDEERSKPEEKTHLTWQDVVSVFDFICLQEEYEPITVAELSYFLNTGEGQNDISDRTVAGSVQVLLTLGLVERKKDKSGKRAAGNVAVLAYALKEKVDYRDIDLLTGIKQLFDSEKNEPSKADLNVIRSSLETLVEKSNKDRPQREIAALFWKRAAELVKRFAENRKPLSVENCVSEEYDFRETETLLEVLARTGVVMKTRSKAGEIVYEPREMDEIRKKAVSDIFLSLKVPVSSADIPGIKEMVLRRLSSNRKWADVFSTAPVLLWINDVNNLLLSKGLKQDAEYTPAEISAFLNSLGKGYNTDGGGLEALTEELAREYSLGEEEKIMLRYRLAFLVSHGKKKEQWFFNARSIVRWLDGVGEEMDEMLYKGTFFSDRERRFGDKIDALRKNIDKLDIDLFLLSRIGLLDAGDEPCMYTIGTFTSARKFAELVDTRLNEKLLGMPVSQLHEKKVREALFDMTWPLALFVFSSLRPYASS